MHPTLFHLGPIPVRSYGLMMMVGFLVSIHLAARRARKCGADEELVMNLGLLALIVGVVGARVFYVVHYFDVFIHAPNPLLAMINLMAGGLEFYGGFLCAVAVLILYIRRKKRSLRLYLDILAPAIMLGLAFGRIGCFLNGCCWGRTADSPVSVRFPYASLVYAHQWRETHQLALPGEFIMASPGGLSMLIPSDVMAMSDEEFAEALKDAKPTSDRGTVLGLVNGHLKQYGVTLAELKDLAKHLDADKSLPVLPTQLFSCANALILSLFLGWYFWRRRRHGMVIAILFVIYPITRFLLEAIRTDNPHDTLGLTVSQGISVIAVPLALLAILYLRRLPEVSPYVQIERDTLQAAKAEREKKQAEKKKANKSRGDRTQS